MKPIFRNVFLLVSLSSCSSVTLTNRKFYNFLAPPKMVKTFFSAIMIKMTESINYVDQALHTKTCEFVADQMGELMILECTKNSSIHKLPDNVRHETFKKKAKLIALRRKLLFDLDTLITPHNEAFKNLSESHKKALIKKISGMKKIFQCIDYVGNRTFFGHAMFVQNPLETNEEKAVIGFIDGMVEQKIVDLVILSVKPDEECSAHEMQKKRTMMQKRAGTLQKLISTDAPLWLRLIAKSKFCMNFLIPYLIF